MIKKTPKDGDYRYIWKFIWFPTHFSNGCWIWLQKCIYDKYILVKECLYVVGVMCAYPTQKMDYR